MTAKDNDGQQATTQVSARIPTAHVDRLTKIAEDEDRSLSAEIRRLIRERIAEADGKA